MNAFLLLLSASLAAVGAPLLAVSCLFPGAEGLRGRWAELVFAGTAVVVAGMILAAAVDVGSLPPVLDDSGAAATLLSVTAE